MAALQGCRRGADKIAQPVKIGPPHVVPCRDKAPGPLPHPPMPGQVERRGPRHVNQQAIRAGDDVLVHRRCIIGDDAHTGRHRLEHRHADPFGQPRRDEDVGVEQDALERRRILEPDTAGDAEGVNLLGRRQLQRGGFDLRVRRDMEMEAVRPPIAEDLPDLRPADLGDPPPQEGGRFRLRRHRRKAVGVGKVLQVEGEQAVPRHPLMQATTKGDDAQSGQRPPIIRPESLAAIPHRDENDVRFGLVTSSPRQQLRDLLRLPHHDEVEAAIDHILDHRLRRFALPGLIPKIFDRAASQNFINEEFI